jgi:hypothetical protein
VRATMASDRAEEGVERDGALRAGGGRAVTGRVAGEGVRLAAAGVIHAEAAGIESVRRRSALRVVIGLVIRSVADCALNPPSQPSGNSEATLVAPTLHRNINCVT